MSERLLDTTAGGRNRLPRRTTRNATFHWVLTFLIMMTHGFFAEAAEPERTPEAEVLLQRFMELARLATDDDPGNDRVLSGQAGLHGRTSTDAFLREAGTAASGAVPTIFALSYDYSFDPSTGQVGLSSERVDTLAEQHLDAGGVVMLSARFRHPVEPQGGHRWKKGKRVPLGSLLRVVQPNSGRECFWRQVDLLGDRILAYQEKDYPVLLRLFWEMDIPSAVFWWGSREPGRFVSLWREVVVYLREEKGIQNVLFVFSPAGSNRNTGTPESAYYPGDEFVDLVALTAYSDQFSDRANEKTREVIRCYELLKRVAPGKPMGFAEVGPKSPETAYDWTDFLTGLKESFPEAGFFTAHNNGWALTETSESIVIPGHLPNREVGRFLKDKRVINLPGWNNLP